MKRCFLNPVTWLRMLGRVLWMHHTSVVLVLVFSSLLGGFLPFPFPLGGFRGFLPSSSGSVAGAFCLFAAKVRLSM